MSDDISLQDTNQGYVFEKVSINSKAISSTLKTKIVGNTILEKITNIDSKVISALKTKIVGNDVLKEITSISSRYIEKILISYNNNSLRLITNQINYIFLRGERVQRNYLTYTTLLPLYLVYKGQQALYTLL